MPNDLISLPAAPSPRIEECEAWTILVIDDDEQVHLVTTLALDGYRFKGRPVRILSAYSGKAARELLITTENIGLVLLDVVMESENAGLDLVQFIRVQQRNSRVRIVLRTGQPGQAPPREVIQNYDIDDYRTKTELTYDRLYVVVTAALRTYDLITRMIESQQELDHLANHDPLTGLPNRALLRDRIAQSLALSRRNSTQVAVLFIDIDGFKYINDSFGHTLGDSLLREIAIRLEAATREGDTVSRHGGDEFVIVLNGITGEDEAWKIAEKLLNDLPQPILTEGSSLAITASIGLSLHPQDGNDHESLLKNADAALCMAKQRGRNCVQAYQREMSVVAGERVVLEYALRQAQALHQLELHYQPQIDTHTGRISGVEALMRWTHPSLGAVSPQRFIPLAEEIGLIQSIGEWALSGACRQLHEWHLRGYDQLVMAINMSVRQFHQRDVLAMIREILQVSGIPGASLELELTESILISDPESVTNTLHELKALGISISMDDFGTGYSGLSYLSRFPIDRIKIDQSFTSRVSQSGEAASIVRAIVALAKSLNLKTVCEGVETVEQAVFMRDGGCDALQGYLFSRALPAEEMSVLLAKYSTATGAIQALNDWHG